MPIERLTANLELLRRFGRTFPINREGCDRCKLRPKFKVVGGTGKTDYFGPAMGGALQGVFAGILVSETAECVYAYLEQRALELLQSCEYLSSLGVKITELNLADGSVRTFSSAFSLRLARDLKAAPPTKKSLTHLLSCLAGAIHHPVTQEIKDELVKVFPLQGNPYVMLDGLLTLPFEVTQAMLDAQAQESARRWAERLKRVRFVRPVGQVSSLDLIQMLGDTLSLDAVRRGFGLSDEAELRQELTTPLQIDMADYRHIALVGWREYWKFWQDAYQSRDIKVPLPDSSDA